CMHRRPQSAMQSSSCLGFLIEHDLSENRSNPRLRRGRALRIMLSPPESIGAVPMASDTMASIVAFQQPKRARRSAQRTRTQRKRKAKAAAAPETEVVAAPEAEAAAFEAESTFSEALIPAGFSGA